jgi:hypothetical protein
MAHFLPFELFDAPYFEEALGNSAEHEEFL